MAAVANAPATHEPLLKLRELDKHFGPVQALYHVDLDLPSGQVTALCGDNGAGKSVLTKCIAGIYQPDHGQVFWEGHPVHIRSARDSARLGIETVYQDLALCDNLDVVGNLYLGGKLQFNDVTVKKDGIYTVNVAYVSGDPRSVTVFSNSGNGTSLKFPSTGDWGTVETVSVQLALKAGSNTITFDSGSSGYAPDIDKIDVPQSV